MGCIWKNHVPGRRALWRVPLQAPTCPMACPDKASQTAPLARCMPASPSDLWAGLSRPWGASPNRSSSVLCLSIAYLERCCRAGSRKDLTNLTNQGCKRPPTDLTDQPTSETWSVWEFWSTNFKIIIEYGRLHDFAVGIEKRYGKLVWGMGGGRTEFNCSKNSPSAMQGGRPQAWKLATHFFLEYPCRYYMVMYANPYMVSWPGIT